MVFVAHSAFGGGIHDLSGTQSPSWRSILAAIDLGDVGVSLFFVVSGYLITTLMLKEIGANGNVNLGHFYWRRFFRIFPPYYVYLAVIAGLWILHRVPLSREGIVSALTYTSNYSTYIWSHTKSATWLVAHTWTLSLEEQYYLLWPLALYMLGSKRAAKVGVVLLLLTPVSRMISQHVWPNLYVGFQIIRMFHTRIDTIMAGSVLALAGTWPRFQMLLERAVRYPITAVAASGLLLLDLVGNVVYRRFHVSVGVSIEGILLAYLVWYCIHNADTFLGKVLNNRVLAHFGIISYGLYLWQQLFLGPQVLFHGSFLVELVLIVGSAELSYWVVEKGSYAVRDRLMSSAPASPAVGWSSTQTTRSVSAGEGLPMATGSEL